MERHAGVDPGARNAVIIARKPDWFGNGFVTARDIERAVIEPKRFKKKLSPRRKGAKRKKKLKRQVQVHLS